MQDMDDRSFHLEDRIPGAATDVEKLAMAAADTTRAVRARVAAQDLEQTRFEIDRPFLLKPGHVFGGLRGEGHRESRRTFERGVDFVDPAGLGFREGVVGRDVGLDVEDRRAVDQVAGPEDKLTLADLNQLDGGDAERVGAVRGAGGEDTSSLRRAARREDFRPPVGVTVEPPEQPDAVEAFEVLERLLIFVAREHLEDVRLRLAFVGLMPGVELQRLAGADEADGRDGEAGFQDRSGVGFAR